MKFATAFNAAIYASGCYFIIGNVIDAITWLAAR